MQRKKLLAVVLALAMICLMFAGCSSKTSNEGDTNKNDVSGNNQTNNDEPKGDESGNKDSGAELADTITCGLTQDLESCNPWLMAHDGRQQVLYNTVYEPLAQLNVDGELELIIAKSIEKNDDGSYSLEIWDNVYDSAGEHITASDIVFSFDQCIAAGQLAWGVRYLDHFDIIDDTHLTMYLKDESAVGLNMLLKTCHIVSQASYEASSNGFATNPIGTGPYVLDEYTPGSSARIVARDDYWQTDESARSSFSTVGSIKTVNFTIITESSQLALALEMGTIDAIAGNIMLSKTDLGLFMSDDREPLDGYNAKEYLSSLIYQLEMNCGEHSALSDVRVRQAIAYAIDTEAIIQNVFGSDGAAATTNSSPYYADYDESLNDEVLYAYDPDKAADLLNEAGYGGGLTIKLLSMNNENNTKMATLIQSYLGDVGITVQVDTVESALFNTTRLDTVGDKWDMVLNTVMSINTPGRFSTLDVNAFETGKNGLYIYDETLQELFLKANLAETYSVDTVTTLLNYVDENCFLYPVGYSYGYVVTSDKFDTITLDRNCALIYGQCVVNK
ncbi:MAG: ABC transporter substrate-binding protein [Oscillospiraceae bacterium]